MGSLNVKGYTRIHFDISGKTIRFAASLDEFVLGESLLNFIYSDLKSMLNKKSYKIDDFKKIHPYFEYVDEEWQNEFIKNLTAEEKSAAYPLVEDLLLLQDNYAALLDSLYTEDAAKTDKSLVAVLSQNPWLMEQKAFVSMEFKTGSEDELFFDCFVSAFSDVLFMEFSELVRRRTVMRVCRNCGKIFRPVRSNSEYCQRPYTSDGKTCAEVGYSQTFARNMRNDELLMAYNKAYKAHYARMSKPRKRMANMTREEFDAWRLEAKDKLNLARAGRLDGEEFKLWLKK